MQNFFAISYYGYKRKFDKIVVPYIESIPGSQIRDHRSTTLWWLITCIIPVASKEEALQQRKHMEAICKQVSPKCEPYYYRFRNRDEDLNRLSIMGLNGEESKIFNEKAPPGVFRTIEV